MKSIKYIVENERDVLWGLSISTVGHEEIAKGEMYPTKKHHASYYFSPLKGRILDEYQLIYITDGEGFFESSNIEKTHIKSGSMFLLFPGEWHSYHPSVETGWKLYWIGFKGGNMDSRVKNGFLSKKTPIFYIGINEEVVKLYRQAIEVATQEKMFFQQLLAGIVNHLLGMMYSLDRENRLNKNLQIAQRINYARVLMNEHVEEDYSIHDVAHELGMGYNSFRKLFKEYTGLSPAHYFQNIKMQRAKELLTTTQMTIKEIAYKLNFESADYFSTQFKKKTGKRPSDFK